MRRLANKIHGPDRRPGAAPLIAVALLFAAIPLPALAAEAANDVAAHMRSVEQARSHGPANARSDAERDLIQADLDFAADAQRRHVAEAFRDRFAPDGILIGPDEPVRFGREAAYQSMLQSRAQWHWAPVAARVDGDLGVTWGVAAILYRNAAGEQASIQTRYVTAWIRRDGRWEMWVDTGNVGPGPDLDAPAVAEVQRMPRNRDESLRR